jgi:hypothetical protein
MNIIGGNGNNLSVCDDNSTGDIIILGDGDLVSAIGSSYDSITLGNGASDSVNAAGSSYANGAGDSVNGFASTPTGNVFGINHGTITFGDGVGDSVLDRVGGSYNTITLGNQ